MSNAREKARRAWSCRRGMLELDLMLQHFLEHHIDELSDEELKTFDVLLTYPDPQLFSWLMGHEDPLEEALYKIVTFIRNNHSS